MGALKLICYVCAAVLAEVSWWWESLDCVWRRCIFCLAWGDVLSHGPESSPRPWRKIIAAPFAGSDGGEMAALVVTGPGMKLEDMLAVRLLAVASLKAQLGFLCQKFQLLQR